jgi:hypothetical protein
MQAWKNKIGWDNPESFAQKISELKVRNSLTKGAFVEIVKDYLLDFHDLHIFFKYQHAAEMKTQFRGFQVRRYEDRLYVSQVDGEDRLKKGRSFITLGGYTIPELRERHSRLLHANHAERENWTPILSLYEEGELEDLEGKGSMISLNFYDRSSYQPEYTVEKLTDDTLFITMTDFQDPDAIIKMMKENQELLNSVEKWIIDVRVNRGGSTASFYPLIPYLMPEEGVELLDKDDKMFFNCTEASAERQLDVFGKELEQIQDEQAQLALKVFLKEWERNKGKGFVEFDFGELIPDTFVIGSKHPKKIIVLSDVMCGSSGDSFVEVCKKSNKVTVMGRATLGVNDYSNLATKRWDEGFELMYPTSRLSRIDKGEGMTGKGIEPDIYIPWTPKHLETGVDVKRALQVLASGQ